MKYHAASRKVIIQDVSVSRVTQGSLGFPSMAFKGEDVPPEVWLVFIRVREGMKPETTEIRICRSEEEVAQIVEAYPVGTEIPEHNLPLTKYLKQDFIRRVIDDGGKILGAGDGDLYLPWRVLVDAEISESNGIHTSQKVLDFLGTQRVGELKERFGENWGGAAEFEYCWLNMPHSSAAFIAAACRFNYYISENDFAAGYLLRDLEVLVHGVEAEATKAIETRKKAGAAGSKKSATARKARRTALFAAMEEVAQRNPDVVKLGERALANLALTHSIEGEPALWRQGRGQYMEYVGEIRRGEAGEEIQARYLALLGRKPPRRFG